jgi:hypothetical protein
MSLYTEYTNEYDHDDIRSKKWLAGLSYLGILVLIPVFAGKRSPYTGFHVSQGLVLMLFKLIYMFAAVLLLIIGYAITASIGKIFLVLLVIAGILLIAEGIIGIVNALSGKARTLPYIGQIKLFNQQ